MNSNFLEEISSIIFEAAEIFHKEEQRGLDVSVKSHNSLVTQIDANIEKKLVKELSLLLPEAGFIAEEGTSSKNSDTLNWVIDPVDGTTNMIHGVPHFCISVALLKENVITHAAVYEFNQREIALAEKNSGSFLNGKKMTCSSSLQLSDSLLATGFPYYDYDWMEAYMLVLQRFMQKTRGLRRLGSAAYDLLGVAKGIFDGFYEYSLHPWDVAGGVLLVTEAGGHVSDFVGGNNYLFGKEIIASNSHIHSEMLEVIELHFNN